MLKESKKEFKGMKKKSKRYSAVLLPVEATLTFLSAVTSNFIVSSLLDRFAKKGKLNDFYNPTKNTLGQAHLNILKDRILLLTTLIVVPFVSYLVNKVFPNIINKIFPNFLEGSEKGKDK